MAETNEISEVNGDRAVQPAQSESMLPLIQQAIAGGADPSKMEKWIELHERWLLARAAERFGDAIAAFQAEMPVIEKKRIILDRDKKVRSKYAAYEDIKKIAGPLLAKHGISSAYDTKDVTIDGIRFIEAKITLQVGSYSKDWNFMCPIPMDMNCSQPQKWGAALMFARRYAFTAALDIVTCDEDTNAADVISTITAIQFKELDKLCRERVFNYRKFLEWVEAESLEMIPLEKFEKAKKQLLSFPLKPAPKPEVDGDPEP